MSIGKEADTEEGKRRSACHYIPHATENTERTCFFCACLPCVCWTQLLTRLPTCKRDTDRTDSKSAKDGGEGAPRTSSRRRPLEKELWQHPQDPISFLLQTLDDRHLTFCKCLRISSGPNSSARARSTDDREAWTLVRKQTPRRHPFFCQRPSHLINRLPIPPSISIHRLAPLHIYVFRRRLSAPRIGIRHVYVQQEF